MAKTKKAAKAKKVAGDPQPAPSWLQLDEAPAHAEIEALYRRTQGKIGYVRNGQRVAAHRPELALAQDALSRAVNSDREGGLGAKERELIALVVSVQNRCPACVLGHAAALREVTGDPFWTAKVEVNVRHAALTARERALVDYALKITSAPAEIEAADLEHLRKAGLTEIEILDAAAIAAYFNFSNRINSALGVEPNLESYTAHR